MNNKMEFIWHTHKQNKRMCRYDKVKKHWRRNQIGYAMHAELPCNFRYQLYIPFTPTSLAFVQQNFLLQISQKKEGGERWAEVTGQPVSDFI